VFDCKRRLYLQWLEGHFGKLGLVAMNIRQLQYFLGVLKDRSITKAATRMYVAQPALGLQIRKLEEEFKVDLITRHSRGIVATEAGMRLAAQAEILLRQFEKISQDMLEYSGEPQGLVAVGLTSGTSLVLAAKLVESCRREYPGINLRLTEALSEQLMEWVVDGRIDLTLTYNPNIISGLISEPLASEELYFVQNSQKIELDEDQCTLANILQTDLALPTNPHLVRVLVEEAARKIGKEVQVSTEMDSVHVIKELIRQNLVSSIMPLTTIMREVDSGEFVAWPVKEPSLQRTLFIAHSTHHPSSKAFMAVVNLMRNSVREFAEKGEVGWTVYGSDKQRKATSVQD
jgi:LysR family nitrogen assimilation transcriptional regulator